MLRWAGESIRCLAPERAAAVRGFLRSQFNSDGGCRNRAGASDLYYTVFALEACQALGEPINRAAVQNYLERFGDGEGLDLVHLCCLGRCWASLGPCEPNLAATLLRQIEAYRTGDGGYNPALASASGTAYGCFLVTGVIEDLQGTIPADGIVHCLESLKDADGGYMNGPDIPVSNTPTTAAAVTILRHLGRPIDAGSVSWLESRCHHEGGFLAIPDAPIPDLLSTATALHALAGEGVKLAGLRTPCADFVDSLWSDAGAFRGNWLDDALDCEYTWYGLIALGHLAE